MLALAVVTRFLWLGHASLWIDELFSVSWSQLDVSFLLGEGARTETNPPAYYILLHGWMSAFGTTEIAIRGLSALISAVTVLVAYAIGRMLKDRRTALLAGLLLAVNPVAVTYAQEARAYSLMALLDGVGLLSIVGCLRHPDAAGRRPWPWLAAFVVSVVAAVSAHYTSLLFAGACFAAMGWRLATTRPFPVREALAWVVAGVLTALALLKLVILAASLSGSSNLVWIGPLTAMSVVSFLLDLIAPLPQAGWSLAIAWISCAALLLVVVGAWPRLRGDRETFGVLVLVPGLYCALLIAGSLLRPMLLTRVASWLVIPLCLILAWAALEQPSRWRRRGACAAPLLIFLFCLGHYYRFYEKEDWREAARLAATQPRCQGPVLAGDFNALGLRYYGIQARREAYVFLPDPRRRDSVEFRLSERLMHLPELEPGAVVKFIETHPDTVVILPGEYAQTIPAGLQDRLAHAPFMARLSGGLAMACF